MWETVPRLLGQHRYLVIGTTNDDGRPWVSPVFFAPDGTHRIVWVSAPDSRHSRNIAARSDVAITVFDTSVPVGEAEALYLEATAGFVLDEQCAASLALLNDRLPTGKRLEPDDVGPAGPMRLYQATITAHYVLIRGGDTRFENVTDARLLVTEADTEAPTENEALTENEAPTELEKRP
ncbi:pyridoxamine 5'-phosphate oxidase family protein [Catenulispora yoronensis]